MYLEARLAKMATRIASRTLSGRKTKSLAYTNIVSADATNESATYTRPSDWLTLPTITAADHKFVGLHAVYENSPNFCVVRCTMSSSGTYLIDWGDGTTTTSANNINQSHSYQYTNSVFDGTLSTRGYKQAIITVTPITGNITALFIYNRPNTTTVTLTGVSTSKLTRYSTGWLDISLALPYCTNLSFTDASSTNNRILEQARIYKVSDSLTSYGSLFRQCYQFRSLPVLYHGTGLNNFNYMFQDCWSLDQVPAVLDFTNITTTNNMFQSCYRIKNINVALPKVTNADSMFNYCRSLREVTITSCGGSLTGSSKFNASSMLSYNTALVSVTFDNIDKLQYLNSTFRDCYSLQSVRIPYSTSNNLNQCDATFYNCRNLKTTPPLNTSAVFGINNMFGECYSLTSIPAYDFSSVTEASGTFGGCRSIKEIPKCYTPLMTNANSLFTSCYNLRKDPEWDYSSVTSGDNMFSQCKSLTSVTANMPVNVNFNSMFGGCQSLLKVNLTTGRSTARYMTSTFNGCHSLPSEGLNWTFTGTSERTYSGNIYIQAAAGNRDGNQSGWITTDTWYPNVIGQTITISGTSLSNGTTYDGVIPGYTNPTTYYIVETDEHTQIRISATRGGTPISGFTNATGLPTGGLTFKLNGIILQDMDGTFQYNYAWHTTPTFPAELIAPNAIRRVDGMFYECYSLKIVPDNFIDVSNCTTVGSLFRHCYSLERGPALNTSRAETLDYMYESCWTIQYIPTYNTTKCTNFDNFASSCYNLHKAPTMSMSATTYCQSAFGSCYSLVDGSGLTDIRESISFDNCQLSGTSLNAIYTNLPTVSGKNINVTVNWGSVSTGSAGTWNAPHTPSIATAKGWTVSS